VTMRKIYNLILVLVCIPVFVACSAHQEKVIREDPSAQQKVVVAKSPLSIEKLNTSLPQPSFDSSVDATSSRTEQKKNVPEPEKTSESVSSQILANMQGTVHNTKKNNSTPPSDAPDVALNFDNADIYEVLNVFSEILGINYLVDPRVKGVVTIRTTGKVAVNSSWPCSTRFSN